MAYRIVDPALQYFKMRSMPSYNPVAIRPIMISSYHSKTSLADPPTWMKLTIGSPMELHLQPPRRGHLSAP